MDKLEDLIREKQAERKALQDNLDDALTGIESPDYRRADKIYRAVLEADSELRRLERTMGYHRLL